MPAYPGPVTLALTATAGISSLCWYGCQNGQFSGSVALPPAPELPSLPSLPSPQLQQELQSLPPPSQGTREIAVEEINAEEIDAVASEQETLQRNDVKMIAMSLAFILDIVLVYFGYRRCCQRRCQKERQVGSTSGMVQPRPCKPSVSKPVTTLPADVAPAGDQDLPPLDDFPDCAEAPVPVTSTLPTCQFSLGKMSGDGVGAASLTFLAADFRTLPAEAWAKLHRRFNKADKQEALRLEASKLLMTATLDGRLGAKLQRLREASMASPTPASPTPASPIPAQEEQEDLKKQEEVSREKKLEDYLPQEVPAPKPSTDPALQAKIAEALQEAKMRKSPLAQSGPRIGMKGKSSNVPASSLPADEMQKKIAENIEAAKLRAGGIHSSPVQDVEAIARQALEASKVRKMASPGGASALPSPPSQRHSPRHDLKKIMKGEQDFLAAVPSPSRSPQSGFGSSPSPFREVPVLPSGVVETTPSKKGDFHQTISNRYRDAMEAWGVAEPR